jgi:glycosyltransferase involved in cell wall biosynthesis
MRLIYPVLWSRLGRDACQEQTANTVAALARHGLDVTLVVPQGARDPAIDADGFRDWFKVSGDVRILQRPSRWAGENMFRSARWLGQVFADPALRAADLLYSRAPVMLGIGSGSPLPFVTDHYRPWPDAWPWLRPLIRRTARQRRGLGFILHSAFAADSYRRAQVAPEKLLVAHNGADAVRMAKTVGKSEARERLGLPADRPIAVYAGRINEQKGLDQVLALAGLRPDVLFLLVGSEGEGPIEAAARELANVTVFPWQEPDTLPLFLWAADVTLIPASSAPLVRFGNCVLPIKSFAYLAAGRPILAPRAPDTAELLRDGENALLVAPGRPEEAGAALDRILGDPALAARLAEGALATAEGLSWDGRARKIASFLEERLFAARGRA